jgi:hypothetical protein
MTGRFTHKKAARALGGGLALLLAALALAAPARAAGPSTDPPPVNQPQGGYPANPRQAAPDEGQQRGIPGFVLPAPWSRPFVPAIKPRVVARLIGPYTNAGTYDRDLSRLCRQGLFEEQVQGLWQVKFVDDVRPATLGAAKIGSNLIDTTRVAERDQVYLFRNADSPRCEVYRWQGVWPPQQ